MTTTREILQRRNRLKSEEKKLVSELEENTVALESSLKSSLKTLAIIGAGALTVTAIYYLLSDNNDDNGSEKKKSKKSAVVKNPPSPITASIITTIIQKLLPLALEKFSKLTAKDEKHG